MVTNIMKPVKINTMLRIFSILLISILTISMTSPFLGVVFAREAGSANILVEGYDGKTVMQAALSDSKSKLLDNKTVASASFTYTNLTVGEKYSLQLTYKSIPYTAEIDVKQPTQDVAIKVYELTSDDEDIAIEFHHVSFSRGEDSLNVTEFIQFYNSGNKVHNGTDLKVAMPQGFKNFRSAHSCCVTKTDFGYFFKLPTPLKPNESQTIDLRYELTPDTDEYAFLKRAYYYTGVMIVTSKVDDVKVVSSENLQSEGPVDLGYGTFDAYSYSNVYAGEGFSITITGYKSGGLTILYAGTGALLLLIIGAVIYGFKRSHVSLQQLQSAEEALNAVLAELEKDFSEGKIKEVDYLKLKLKYKARLEKISKHLQQYPKVEKKQSAVEKS